MTTAAKVAITSAIFAIVAAFALPQPAQAWETVQLAKAVCNADRETVVIEWAFTNTEPNDPKWAMDVVARDSVTGNESPKVTVNPGETTVGYIDTGRSEINKNGQVEFHLTWADGRDGVDKRTAGYDMKNCNYVEVCRDDVIVRIAETDRRDTDGDAVECEPVEIEVCRDGEVITITEDERQDGDTDNLEGCAPEEEEQIEVCRDGEVITIDASDKKSTDTDAADCDEDTGEVLPETLPNTGPVAAALGVFGVSGLGLTVRNWLDSRRTLRDKLLGKN